MKSFKISILVTKIFFSSEKTIKLINGGGGGAPIRAGVGNFFKKKISVGPMYSEPRSTCSNSTIEKLEKGVKYEKVN